MRMSALALCFSILISGCSSQPDNQGTIAGMVSSVEKLDRPLKQGIYIYLTEQSRPMGQRADEVSICHKKDTSKVLSENT